MSAPRTLRLAAVLASAGTLLAGCIGTVRTDAAAGAPGRSGSAIIITQAQIRAAGTGLLDGLRGKVNSMRVSRMAGRRCPLITLRGARTFIGSSDPQVYVDGTPMLDTCILDQIRTREVEHVEIYPGGVSTRAGYRSSPNGLILVFLTGGPPAR